MTNTNENSKNRSKGTSSLIASRPAPPPKKGLNDPRDPTPGSFPSNVKR